MSLVLYGAVNLTNTPSSVRDDVVAYWKQIAGMHGIRVRCGQPGLDYLNSVQENFLLECWKEPTWIRFAIADPRTDGWSANGLILQAQASAHRVLMNRGNNPVVADVWPWVPQWRGISFLFWHEAILDAYLVIEDTSASAATESDLRYVSLTKALSDLWKRYCYDTTDEPSVYRLDLSALPM